MQASGKVCLGTVKGDLHDIGKNLVKMMMEGKGLEVIDLGTDVDPETFVRTAIEEHCQIIACSALLTTTMGVMKEVVEAAEAAGIRDQVKIMIGGAPVTQAFCDQIGADAYTPDATSAAEKATEAKAVRMYSKFRRFTRIFSVSPLAHMLPNTASVPLVKIRWVFFMLYSV